MDKKTRKQIKVYVGGQTWQQWNEVRRQFTSGSAAFAAIVQRFYDAIHTQVEDNHGKEMENDTPNC